MLEDVKLGLKKLSISTIQKYILLFLFFLLPITILPFPWDWTERGMSLLILISSTSILGLELIKLIWEGKTSILKSSMDVGTFLLLLSFLISTIFSKDINTSIWGIDSRLGGSLIIFISVLLVSISARTFIRDGKDIKSLILFFLAGLFLNNFLSIFSFLGINIWGALPVYKDLYQLGLPLLRSAKVHILINIISLIFCTGFLGEYILEGKERFKFVLSLIFVSLSIFNIWIYSINQGSNLLITSFLVILLLSIVWIRRMKLKTDSLIKIIFLTGGLILLILIPFILLRIPTMRVGILPKDLDLVTEISLGADISWIIALAVFLSSFVRGLFGMGMDTYSISYYLYKPQNENLLAFNRATFYSASSELFTQLTNGGLFWLLVWSLIGFLIIKSLWNDLKEVPLYQDVASCFRLFMIDLAILIIYLSSIFLSYTVLLLVIFLILISIRSIIRDSLRQGVEDKFIIKFWAVDFSLSSSKGKSLFRLNTLFTLITVFFIVGISWLWISKGISSLYALRAESFFIEQNRKYQGDLSPTLEERESFISSMSHYYSKAVSFDKDNSLYNRRLSAIYLERLGVTIERYSQIEEDGSSKYQLMQDITTWKNLTVDSTRRSIDVSPFVYSNWESKVIVYTGLLNLGFYDYIPDSISAFERAIELNPLNFELHYGLSQIYLTKKEQDKALVSLAEVLKINSQHIPSILLMGDIFRSRGDIEIYESYLKAAKKILEAQGNTDSDYYVEINKELRILENQDNSEEEEDSKEEGELEIVDVEIENLEFSE